MRDQFIDQKPIYNCICRSNSDRHRNAGCTDSMEPQWISNGRSRVPEGCRSGEGSQCRTILFTIWRGNSLTIHDVYPYLISLSYIYLSVFKLFYNFKNTQFNIVLFGDF